MDLISRSVDDLAEMVGWRGQPKYRPNWNVTENVLGFAIPDDFKQLLSVIPVGEYGGAILVSPPTAVGHEGDHLYLFRQLFRTLKTAKNVPYPVHPQVPGLLPCARGAGKSAGFLFWLTDGNDPNDWPVVLTDTVLQRWEQYDVGIVDFLTVLVKGDLPSKIIESSAATPRYKTYQDLPGAPNNTGMM